MKFNWGTGIFIFLVLFVAGAIAFIIFASKQHVNLVHKDYYEKGVDYSEQMKIDARSKQYSRLIDINSSNDYLLVEIDELLASKIDSGSIHLYRPSDSKKDVRIQVEAKTRNVQFQKQDLINGRYILKFYWYSDGLKYEVDRPVNVQ
jgi:hypothetical protein